MPRSEHPRSQSPGERALLQAIRSLAQRTPKARSKSIVRIGIGDDCAVLTPRPGEELVVTTDFSIEDRHFRRAWHPPEAVGYKCLARGLSDIASMGARPVAAFVSLALPRAMTVSSSKHQPAWITRFYQGLLALAAREKVTLAGGDLSESPSLAFADVIVLGVVSRGRALLRSTAKAGDILYVTGVLGGAAAELERLENWHAPGKRTGRPLPQPRPDSYLDQHASETHPHFYPQPRIAVGQALLRRGLATSCIDISDGLSTDLLHLCEESSLSAEVDASAIPLATSAHGTSATLEQALHGGDDYELLFTAPANTRMPRQLAGIPIHPIGRMFAKRRGPRITLLNQNSGKPKRTPLHPQGWQHF